MNAADLLFVYGTLLSGDAGVLGAGERLQLAAEGECLGTARAIGRLYDLGDYPGFVRCGAEVDALVSGELVRLRTPAVTLRWLDEYEGVFRRPDDEYERVFHEVETADGGRLTAWVYVFRGAVAEAGLIHGGSWLKRDKHTRRLS